MFIEVRGIGKLKSKFANGFVQFKSHVINELNVMVKNIEGEAKSDASNLPYLTANSSYVRTNYLSNSITSIPYNGSYASVVVNAKYGPYVEFGTGTGFGIQKYKYNLTPRHILPYASIFKGSGGKNSNMGYRTYLFKNFEIEYTKALKGIKSFKLQ
jgi:hypothetical protein